MPTNCHGPQPININTNPTKQNQQQVKKSKYPLKSSRSMNIIPLTRPPSDIPISAIEDLELVEYYIDFELICHPDESSLVGFDQHRIRCKGCATIISIKKLIINMNKLHNQDFDDKSITIDHIEILLSMNIADKGSCSVLADEMTLSHISEYLASSSQSQQAIVLLFRSKTAT
jgi:hypothetical protein